MFFIRWRGGRCLCQLGFCLGGWSVGVSWGVVTRFRFRRLFPLKRSGARCCLLAGSCISMDRFRKGPVLGITGRNLATVTRTTFHSISFLLHHRRGRRITGVLTSPRTDSGSGCITLAFLHGTRISTGKRLPLYRSANATVVRKRGNRRI